MPPQLFRVATRKGLRLRVLDTGHFKDGGQVVPQPFESRPGIRRDRDNAGGRVGQQLSRVATWTAQASCRVVPRLSRVATRKVS